ncbi:unnamed protein product [Pleuronectes platessa]|uniref:Uncharacterized protein n=1 Tax=Pleuronectes platessa TaxID=8262 RepID=A0A9N7UI32_PLEPL|nr:unnamed protein product [Pleuronectes platessa]
MNQQRSAEQLHFRLSSHQAAYFGGCREHDPQTSLWSPSRCWRHCQVPAGPVWQHFTRTRTQTLALRIFRTAPEHRLRPFHQRSNYKHLGFKWGGDMLIEDSTDYKSEGILTTSPWRRVVGWVLEAQTETRARTLGRYQLGWM